MSSVLVTDANGCTAEAVVTIGEPSVLQANAAVIREVSCADGNDGIAQVGASGGKTPYTYLWSNGSTNALATGLSAGNYSVTVTDANGCSVQASVILNPRLPLAVTAEVLNPASCNLANGSAKASATGGQAPYTFIWSHGILQTSNSSSTVNGLLPGSYQVTVKDANGCQAVSGVLIPDAGSVSAIIDAHTDVKCFGGNDGAIWISVSGGTLPYTYDWDSNYGFDASSQDITGIKAGVYSVLITDSKGCSIRLTNITIEEPTKLVVEGVDNIPVSCFGYQNGSATVMATGGTSPYTYDWLGMGTTNDGPSRNNLAAGNYTVQVTDANGCTAVVNVLIKQPDPLSALASVPVGGNVSCFGGNDGEATVAVTGGTPPYVYEWSNGSADKTITGLIAGNYYVVVRDANGCTITSNTVSITQPASKVQVIISSFTNPSCAGNVNGTATAQASGGTGPYTYLWSNGQTTATATGLTAGTYVVTAKDANGCEASTSIVLTDPNGLTALFTAWKHVTCYGGNNGQATVVVNGGTSPYDFVWDNGFTVMDVPGPNATSISNGLTAGQHTVTITDAKGCQVVAVIEINEPTPVSATALIISEVSCYGGNNGSALVIAEGGTAPYKYLWSTGQTSYLATGLTAGVKTVTVTDNNKCSVTIDVTIPGPQAPLAVVSKGTDVLCYGTATGMASVTSVTGGTPPYTYSWNTNPVQTSATAINLPVGVYTVTVYDSKNCFVNSTVTISQPASAITLGTPVVTNANCSGNQSGSVQLSASGGTGMLTYTLSTGLSNNNQQKNPNF